MKLDNKNTVVHVACLLHYNAADIIKRLTSEPSIAFERNDANELPLHYAAMDKKGVDNEVLKCLLNTNPKGVKQPNTQNSLPIHLACMVGVPSMTALKTFLKLYPKSVMIQSEFPLLFQKDMMVLEEKHSESKHYEVEESESSEDDVEYVSEITNHSNGLVSKLENMLPLQADLRVVHKKKRAEANTTEQHLMDDGPLVETGFSPLHLAILNNANLTAIQMIVTTDPSCIRLKTSMGRTARHCADYIVKQHWLYGAEDEASIENTLKSMEILEEYDGRDRID
jgi:ankyrin repeat protein